MYLLWFAGCLMYVCICICIGTGIRYIHMYLDLYLDGCSSSCESFQVDFVQLFEPNFSFDLPFFCTFWWHVLLWIFPLHLFVKFVFEIHLKSV